MDLGVFPINFASMVFGTNVKEISSTCVKTETGVDSQDSITLIYEDGKAAYLYATMLAQSNREGVIHGDKGFIEIVKKFAFIIWIMNLLSGMKSQNKLMDTNTKFWHVKRHWNREQLNARKCRIGKPFGSWN